MTDNHLHEGSHIVNKMTRVINKSNRWFKNWMVSLKFHWSGGRHVEEVSISSFLERSNHHTEWRWTRCRRGSHNGQYKAGSFTTHTHWSNITVTSKSCVHVNLTRKLFNLFVFSCSVMTIAGLKLLKSNMAWVPSLICKNLYFCHCGIIMSCMEVKFCTSNVFRP